MPTPPDPPNKKKSLHPRNRHGEGYDFAALTRTTPALARFVERSPAGDQTIDFSDPAAVMVLNQALLRHHYGVVHWEIPPGYLCPPIPGRADYLHHLADLLGETSVGAVAVPRGPSVRILDIGTGANCVYPIIGTSEYGWRFVGTDVDPVALASAERIIAANPTLVGRIECRRQPSRTHIFRGVVKPAERFAASMCNPPFHASAEEAATGTLRKLRNLSGGHKRKLVLNFGGRSHELWCDGGEVGFVRRLIAESARQPQLCGWFTTLVSKRESLPAIHQALARAGVEGVRTIELAHGQKKSRILAWRYGAPDRSSKRASGSS